jgi:hypothetical protein
MTSAVLTRRVGGEGMNNGLREDGAWAEWTTPKRRISSASACDGFRRVG